jgi:hypothetical protein
MVGSVARNPHTGSRSEILADYLFSGWGTVTPVRRQDDYGVDLHCTLTAEVGQRSIVTDYYSVQVKSDNSPWQFESADEIKWLFDYPTPLFLACVDKKKGELSIYHTMARFLAGFYPPPPRLDLMPSTQDEGEFAQWKDGERFSLSAPILRVSLGDFLDETKLQSLRNVLQTWIALDNYNCDLRRIGILRFRMPHRYRTNEVPDLTGFVERGIIRPTPLQLSRAVRTLFEVIDCVGAQLAAHDDRIAALYAALLMRHLRTSRSAEFADDPRWRLEVSSSVESDVALALNAASDAGASAATYDFTRLERLLGEVTNLNAVSAYLSNSKEAE